MRDSPIRHQTQHNNNNIEKEFVCTARRSEKPTGGGGKKKNVCAALDCVKKTMEKCTVEKLIKFDEKS
jgi:hypothetical protein